jgi:HEAT repeat protein
MSERDESTITIIQQLADQDPEIRAFAAFRLGQRHEALAVNALGNALRDEDHEVRGIAAQSLAMQQEVAYLPIILELLRDEGGPDANPIAWAAAQLAPLADESSREEVRQVLSRMAEGASPAVKEQMRLLLERS